MADDAEDKLDPLTDAPPMPNAVDEADVDDSQNEETSGAPSSLPPALHLQRQVHVPKKKKRRTGGLTASLIGTSVTLVLFIAIVALLALMGRSMDLPDWAVDRIEERVNRDLPGEVINFDSVAIGLRDNAYRPTVDIGGLSIENAGGQRLLELPRLQSKLDTSELLQGRFKVETLELEGAALELARDRNGKIALAFGASMGGGEMQVSSIGELLAQIDTWLASPLLVELEEIDAQDLSIRLADARSGEVATVEEGRLKLINAAEVVTLSLSFDLDQPGGDPASMLLAANKTKGVQGARIVGRFADLQARGLAEQVGALAFLDVLDAPVSGALTAGIDETGEVATLTGSLDIGKGVLQPTPEAKPVPFNSAKTIMRFEAENGRLVFDRIELDSPEVRLEATGHADLLDFEAGIPQTLLGQLRFSNIRLAPEGMFDAPVSFAEGALDLRYRPAALDLDVGQLVLRDDGVELLAKGSVSVLPDGWSVALDAGIDAIRYDRLLALWPQSAVPKTRNWLLTNILGGDAKNVAAAIRVRPEVGFDAAVSFDFSDAKVRYLKTLPPVERAVGFASYTDKAFHLALTEGEIPAPAGGFLQAAGSRLEIPEVDAQPAVGNIDLNLTGPLKAALHTLDLPPFGFLTDSNLSPDIATGQAAIEAELSVPLEAKVALSDIRYAVVAEVKLVQSDTLVEGRTLRAPKMDVFVGDGALSIEGAGTIDGIPMDVVWQRKIGPGTGDASKISGTIELSNKTLDAFNVGLPRGSVSGRGVGQIDIGLRKGQAPDMVLRSNLRGLGLSIPALGWAKGRNGTGSLEVAMRLGKSPKVNGFRIKTAGLETSGDIDLKSSGGLDRAIFTPLKVAGRLNSRVELVGRGNRPPQIKISGGTIDIRKFGVTGGGGGGGASPPMELALDRLLVTDTITLDRFRGTFRGGKGLDGTFTANLNGEAPVQGTVVPTANGPAIRIQSNNGGRVIGATGIFRNANGGDMSLVLQPNGKAGQFDGQLKITNARVKKAPALADLLAALSVIGLLEQLSGDGILFTNVDARFLLTPGGVTLRSSSAVGPSMGITMDGIYNTTSRRMDMQGVISPIYAVNGLFGALFSPRRGEGLFGFNYTLRGSADGPKVGVNPLSVLTPGIFREIFRQPAPKLRN